MRGNEIETLAEFDRRARPGRSMSGWVLQDLDLRERQEALAAMDPAGALFLGCRLTPASEQRLQAAGALAFPVVPDVPFDAYRASLYTAAELYAGLDSGYAHTTDARIYAWSQRVLRPRPGGVSAHDNLAMALHDNAIDDALAEYVRGRRVVGVMGGHDLHRDEAGYAAAAELGAALADAGFTVATGGGPGAMEAANLGASLGAGRLPEALSMLARTPSYRPSVSEWARAGLEVESGAVSTERSLGIPTWFYGHEPPNPFCARIAKYFRNAIREDVLLQVCRSGIVVLPGAAGTVQEVFQAACANYYAPDEDVAPMVLVGREHWTRHLPVWPLLRNLGAGRALGSAVVLVDDPQEVPGVLSDES